MGSLINIGLVIGGRSINNVITPGVSSARSRCDASYRLVHIDKHIGLVNDFPVNTSVGDRRGEMKRSRLTLR